MDPVMIGIAAVVIFVILGGLLFVSKRRNSGAAPKPMVNRPKTLAEQQQELEIQRQMTKATEAAPISQPVTTTANADEELAAAQRLIEQQDYNSAAALLKSTIKAHPRNGQLYLSLLNCYALAKAYHNFDQLYPHVLRLNDPVVTAQANNLKELIDEEQSFNQVVQPAVLTPEAATIPVAAATVTPSSTADSMDFDFFTEAEQSIIKPTATTAAPTTPATTDSDMAFEFDLDDTPKQSVNTSTLSPVAKSHDTDLDFDFDIEDKAPTVTTMQATQTEETVSFDDFAEFDISASTDKPVVTTPATSPKPVDTAVDFDFDIEETTPTKTEVYAATATPVTVTTPSIPEAKPEPMMGDFDFNFDDEVKAPVSSQASPVTPAPSQAAPIVADEMDFDFDISDKVATEQNPVLSPETSTSSPTASNDVVEPLADDFDFNFDEPVVTTPAPIVTPVSPVTEQKTAEIDADFDFNFDDGVAAQPATEKEATLLATASLSTQSDTPLVADELFMVDELDFDVTPSDSSQLDTSSNQNNVVSNPTTQNSDITFDDDFELNFDEVDEHSTSTSQPAQSETLVTTNSPTSNVEVSDEFDLNFDEPTVAAAPQSITPAPVTEQTTKSDNLLADDFDFDLAEEKPVTSATTMVTSEPTPEHPIGLGFEDTLSQLDALNAESLAMPTSPNLTPEATVPDVTTPTDNVSIEAVTDEVQFDNPATTVTSTPVAPIVESAQTGVAQPALTVEQVPLATTSAPVTETPISTTTELASALDVVKSLDTAQLNLDLADQYIQLGEYDSAKRLLAEIDAANRPDIQPQLQALQEKLD